MYSRISVDRLETILDNLLNNQTRSTTRVTHHRIWRSFNQFLVKLDKKLKFWEARATLFLTFMISKGAQSSTIKSYLSAIKCILKMDKYKWNDNMVMINSLTQACRDRVTIRLPIQRSLLDLMIHEINRLFKDQYYLCTLYKALFALGYYGMFRIGELTNSNHVVKASNIHLARNKDKILIILYSSKMHDLAHRLQKVKIEANKGQRIHCPFILMQKYITLRGSYASDSEPLFIFRDNLAVTGNNV